MRFRGFHCDIDSKNGLKILNKKQIIKHYLLEVLNSVPIFLLLYCINKIFKKEKRIHIINRFLMFKSLQ
jgi:hypothetical protein